LLELQEAVVFKLRPSQAEGLKSFVAIMPDRLPHDEVVGPQVLVFLFRCAVFINRLTSEMEENRPGDGHAILKAQGRETLPGGDNVPVEVAKKRKGLRRKAVLSSRLAVQALILGQAFEGILQLHFQSGLHRLLDIPSVAFPEGGKDLINMPG